jgi:hypothetical protein
MAAVEPCADIACHDNVTFFLSTTGAETTFPYIIVECDPTVCDFSAHPAYNS